MKENVILTDCSVEELSNFLDGINSFGNFNFKCISKISNGPRTGIKSELKRYSIYFSAAWQAFKNRKKYNIILGWQQFYTLIFCFYCNLFNVKKENTVIALNFTYKEKPGFLGKIYKWFMKKCISDKYLDFIHVLSNEYADNINRSFDFQRERIIVTTFGVNDIYKEYKDCNPPKGYSKNEYVMSIGRSNRDFDLLIDAWKDVDIPLIIISDTFKTTKTLPKNVTLLNNISGYKQYPYISNAKIAIIPIMDGKICSGDTVLLTALSFARTVIVTAPSTLSEMYIQDKVNGYLVRKNEKEIAKLVNEICNGELPELGEAARKSFLQNFSRYSMGKNITKFITNQKRSS